MQHSDSKPPKQRKLQKQLSDDISQYQWFSRADLDLLFGEANAQEIVDDPPTPARVHFGLQQYGIPIGNVTRDQVMSLAQGEQ